MNRIGTAPSDQCTVGAVRPGQTFSRTDSGVPGAGDDLAQRSPTRPSTCGSKYALERRPATGIVRTQSLSAFSSGSTRFSSAFAVCTGPNDGRLPYSESDPTTHLKPQGIQPCHERICESVYAPLKVSGAIPT